MRKNRGLSLTKFITRRSHEKILYLGYQNPASDQNLIKSLIDFKSYGSLKLKGKNPNRNQVLNYLYYLYILKRGCKINNPMLDMTIKMLNNAPVVLRKSSFVTLTKKD